MVQTGITDEILLEETGGGTDITQFLGPITGAGHTVTQDVNQRKSIGQGVKPVTNLDTVAELQGSLDFQPGDMQWLQLFGSFTDNGDGTYTVTLDQTLDQYTFKQQKVDDGGTVTLDNFTFGSFTLDVGEGDTMSVSVDGQSTDFQNDTTETITTPAVTQEPRQFFQCYVEIGGTAVGSVDSASIDHNRSLQQFKGLEDDADGRKRLPTEIIPSDFSLSYSLVVNIENNRAYEEALDDTTSPLEIQDSRSDTTVTLVVETEAGTDRLELTGALFDEVSADMENNGEKRTATITGVALDATVNGDL